MKVSIRQNIQKNLTTEKDEEITIIQAQEEKNYHILTRREIKKNELILCSTKIDEYIIVRKGIIKDEESAPYQQFYIPERLKPKKIQITHTKPEKNSPLVLEIQTTK